MFNNRLYNLIRIIFFLLIINSCDKKCEDTIYYNFSKDELSYVILENTFLGENPISIHILDTVNYTINNQDTIKAIRTRSINNYKLSSYQCPKYMIEAEYRIEFPIDSLIDYASIYQNKDDAFCKNNIHKTLNIISNNNFNNSLYFNSYCYDNNTNYSIDTIFYNNQELQVYIFQLSTDYNEKIKQVYFIKGIGFIKFIDYYNNIIELNN